MSSVIQRGLTERCDHEGATASRDVPAVALSMQPRSTAEHVIEGVPYPLQGEPRPRSLTAGAT